MPHFLAPQPLLLLLLLLCAVANLPAGRSVTASSDPRPASEPDCTPPAALALGAQQICGAASVGAALLSVRVQEQLRAEQALAALGFRHAIDLQLLAGRPEAEELMGELKTDVGLSIPDRAKVRMLVESGTTAEQSRKQPTAGTANIPLGRTSGAEAEHPPIAESPHSALHRLQEQQTVGDKGMSADAIAIVLSVLVGAAGYLVQAYTARRAEQSLAEQAQEQHARELVRQREHEQMLAQIARTDRAVDDCCRPIDATIGELITTRSCWVAGAVVDLEALAPEVVTKMLRLAERAGYIVNAQGQGLSLRSGYVAWDPEKQPDDITRAHGNHSQAAGSAAARVIAAADSVAMHGGPWCNELPTAILDHLNANPASPLADDFRRYVRRAMMPALRRVKELLVTHGAVVELPSAAWMESKFPETNWKSIAVRTFRSYWFTRTCLWEALLEAWEANVFEGLVPPGDYFPFAGLAASNSYAIARGQEVQRELIGCALP